jgi:diguanylate cyclase (GGDEF)-like protein
MMHSILKIEPGSTDRKWLINHRRLLAGLTAVSFLVEILTAVFFHTAGLLSAATWEYISSYILLPSLLCAALTIAAYLASRGERADTRFARFSVSLCFSALCLILYAIHGFFPSIYGLLLAAVVMTTIYGDYALTTATFFMSFAGMILARILREDETAQLLAMNASEMTIDFLFALLMLTGLYAISLVIIHFERQKRREELEKERARLALQEEVLLDAVTGLHNRKGLRKAFDSILAKNSACVFAMSDLNNFKQLNDSYGHTAGDTCLKHFSQILEEEAAPHQVFRYGGDEFCLIFTGISKEEAADICRKIVRRMSQDNPDILGISFGASFGLAEFIPGMTVTSLIQAADEALYQAKTMEGHVCLSASRKPLSE